MALIAGGALMLVPPRAPRCRRRVACPARPLTRISPARRRLRRIGRPPWIGTLLAALLLAGCGGDETTTQALLAPTSPAPAAGTTAPAEAALHHDCEGEGSPTVILEAGFGADSQGWEPLQRELAALTRTCRYDRAGLGRSTLPEEAATRTAADQVADLAALLDDAALEPPYVLVGHSYGGVLARLFAHEHRGDVAGLVFVDSPHPDEREQFLATLPDGGGPVVTRLRQQLTTNFDAASNPERVDWDASMAQVRATGPLGDVPVVVITAGQAGPRTVAGIDAGLADDLERVRMELQRDLAGLSSNGVHVVAIASGHAVPDPQTGQPELVAAAAEAVVRAARLQVAVPSCEALFGGEPRARCFRGRR